MSSLPLRFKEFTGTYLESIRIPFSELSHFLYLFVLVVPSYRYFSYLSFFLKALQRAYTLMIGAYTCYLLKEPM